MVIRWFAAIVALLVFSLLPVAAESEFLARTLTPKDLGRLASFAKARSDAIAEAESGGEAADIAVLHGVLAGEEQPIRGVDIRGEYRCRTVKLGGLLPLTIYSWFSCVIGEDDLGYFLEKTSGSQQLTGHFIDDTETSLIFYGAGHYSDEAPREYGDDPEENIVGRMVKVGSNRYRLEMPLPHFESNFDILELEGL
jgi:hypothetical protein